MEEPGGPGVDVTWFTPNDGVGREEGTTLNIWTLEGLSSWEVSALRTMILEGEVGSFGVDVQGAAGNMMGDWISISFSDIWG